MATILLMTGGAFVAERRTGAILIGVALCALALLALFLPTTAGGGG